MSKLGGKSISYALGLGNMGWQFIFSLYVHKHTQNVFVPRLLDQLCNDFKDTFRYNIQVQCRGETNLVSCGVCDKIKPEQDMRKHTSRGNHPCLGPRQTAQSLDAALSAHTLTPGEDIDASLNRQVQSINTLPLYNQVRKLHLWVTERPVYVK